MLKSVDEDQIPEVTPLIAYYDTLSSLYGVKQELLKENGIKFVVLTLISYLCRLHEEAIDAAAMQKS